ncbi:hypothetical protein HNY73_011760 [Argiope bruennichi]|uniref:Uncharacterized protein n=1 Tax=Argiope bruennichi TaxID=94029 RepID=A0A8T0EXM0_ARGBR|nr:hypothetical protein HNY73_011760 [Argiope bruennichi]
MFIQLRVRTSSYVRRKSVPNAQWNRWKDDVDIQIECGALGWDLMLGLREFCARVKLNSAQKTEAKGLTVGKDKSGAYMTLPSPNVQNADDQDGPTNVFKKLSSMEDEKGEEGGRRVTRPPRPRDCIDRPGPLVAPQRLLFIGITTAHNNRNVTQNRPHSIIRMKELTEFSG